MTGSQMRLRLALALTTALAATNPALADYNPVTGRFTDGAANLTADDLNRALDRKCLLEASACTVTLNGRTVTLADKLQQRVDLVPEFCTMAALGNFMTGTACIQSAVTAMCSAARPGGKLYLPAAYIYARDVLVPCSIAIEGAGASIYTSGTVWDYTGTTGFGLQYKPPGWPAVTHQQLIFGPKVSDINFYATGRTGTALGFKGANSGRVEGIAFTGDALNGLLLYGVYKFDIRSVTGNYLANRGPGLAGDALAIVGDMSGQTRLGAPCTGAGDCSTRTDIVSITNWDTLGTATGAGVHITGTSNTITGINVSAQNKYNGLKVDCLPGFPDISYCPQFLWFTNLHVEGAVQNSIDISDFTDFQCDQCYAVANGAAADHGIKATLVNYTQQGGGGGGLKWKGGRIGNSGGSAAYIAVGDTIIESASIFDANLISTGAAGVEYVSGSIHKERDNIYSTVIGAPSPPMAGTYVHTVTGLTPPKKVSLFGNDYCGTTSGITDTSGVTAAADVLVQAYNRCP